MPFVHVTVERGVARLELDRPPLNVIDLGFARELSAAIEGVTARDDVSILVLSARGRAFSAGVDVRDHLPDRGAAMLRAFHEACFALLEAPQPVVGIVHGPALGGGCELTLVCDLVIASEQATFGLPEIKLGVFPPFAAVALPRMIPFHHASELLLTGRVVDPREAQTMGLVNRVVPAADLDTAAAEVVNDLLALSPESLRLTRQALSRSGVRPTRDEIEQSERFYVEQLMNTPDAIEGLKAFLEKRTARWDSQARAHTEDAHADS